MAVLTKPLARLRTDVNTVAPNRDKESDGWIGDVAHRGTSSGHNPDESGNAEYQDADSKDEVRAVDLDNDLRQPGITMWKIIQAILADPTSLAKLSYIIYNRVIWSRKTGWQPRDYTGPNPHDRHAHFSGRPETDEDASPWRPVLELGDTVTRAELIEAVQAALNTAEGQAAIVKAVFRADDTDRDVWGGEDGGPDARLTALGWSTLGPSKAFAYLIDRLVAEGTPVAQGGAEAANVHLKAMLAELLDRPTVVLDPVQVGQAITAAVQVALANPETLAGLAQAINDDAARRMAS